ncbi:MAG: cobD [Mycobacterium sp.]|nr:cobD [Mycobacterium sp.]
MAPPRADARYHGDQAATEGMLDFAVDVRAVRPPSWLVGRLGDLGRYPSESDHRRATDAVVFTEATTGEPR